MFNSEENARMLERLRLEQLERRLKAFLFPRIEDIQELNMD